MIYDQLLLSSNCHVCRSICETRPLDDCPFDDATDFGLTVISDVMLFISCRTRHSAGVGYESGRKAYSPVATCAVPQQRCQPRTDDICKTMLGIL